MSMKGFQWCYSRWAESDAACFCFSLYKLSDYALGPMVIHGTSYIYGYGFPMDLCTSLVETLWHQRRWTWIEGGVARLSLVAPHTSSDGEHHTRHTSSSHHTRHFPTTTTTGATGRHHTGRCTKWPCIWHTTTTTTTVQYYSIAVLQLCSHRCGSAALCHRSHPSCSHQALRRPTPSQFLTKFLPLKFLTKISPVVQCVYPPIASLFSTIVLCLDLNDLNC